MLQLIECLDSSVFLHTQIKKQKSKPSETYPQP